MQLSPFTRGRTRPCRRLTVALLLALVLTNLLLVDAVRAEATPVAVATSGSSSSRTSITISRPSGTLAGHVMLASIVVNDDDPVTAPAGWALVREDAVPGELRQAVYHRVAGDSEPGSYTWKVGSSRRIAGGITTYAGVDTAQPIDAHGGQAEPGPSTSVTAPSVVTTVANTTLVHFAATSTEGSLSPPSGMDERWEVGSPNSENDRDARASSSDALQAAVAATGVRTATSTEAGAAIGAVVALRPADGSGDEGGKEGDEEEPPPPPPSPPSSEGPIAVVGSSSSEQPRARDSVTLDRPAGTAAGYVLVASVVLNDSAPGLSAPAGWTLLRQETVSGRLLHAVYHRVAGDSEPEAYTWELSEPTTRRIAAGLTAFSGVDTADPVEAHGASVEPAGGLTVVAPSVTVSSAGAHLLHLAAIGAQGSLAPPGGMTERWEASSPNTRNNRDAMASASDAAVAAAGATGPRTATATQAGPRIGIAVALRPAGPPPPSDTDPPDTTITSGPSGTVTTGLATFTFEADEPATFLCRLDSGSFEACTSPRSYTGLSNGEHTFEVKAKDPAGNEDPEPARRTWTVEFVEGDAVLVGAGDISSCSNSNDADTAALIDDVIAEHPDAVVFTAGDNAYQEGTPSEFANCYHPTWGRHRNRTRPAAGNHEYREPNATGYFNYFGSAAGEPGKGYYDYTLGDWHVIVLNSNCDDIGGCHAGSPQEQWLRSVLAASSAECTVAYWHHPRFRSSSVLGKDNRSYELWQALYDHGADLVVNGHDHLYERFAPQRPDGTLDTEFGIPEIIVGTGGKDLDTVSIVAPNSLVRKSSHFGVLKLTLGDGSYGWELLGVGAGVLDSGTGSCHGAPPAAPPPPPPPPGTISVVGTSSSGDPTSRGNITLIRPAGTKPGDVLVASIAVNNDAPNLRAPAGWTLLRQDAIATRLRQSIYYRVVDDDEPTAYSWTLTSSSTRRIAGGLVAFAGVDTANPVVAHQATVESGPGTAVTAPSVVAVENSVLLHFAAVRAEGTLSPPAGMTEHWEAASPAGSSSDVLASVSSGTVDDAGPTGTRTATASRSGSRIGAAVTLRPASG